MLDAQIYAQVATRLIRDLDKDMAKAIARDSKSIGDDLVRWIRSSPGPAPYGKVYAKLGQSAKVRTRSGRPPEVVVGGSKRFSGGATVQQLARPYEFGALTGDWRKNQGKRRLTSAELAGRRHRHRRRRPYPQFPPAAQEGHWLNQICEDRGDEVVEAWLVIVNDTLDQLARKDHG